MSNRLIKQSKREEGRVIILIVLAVCFLCIALFSACKKEVYNSFTITPQDAVFSIEKYTGTANGDLIIDTASGMLNMNEEIGLYAGFGFNIDNIGKISIAEISLEIANPNYTNSIGNFANLSIYLFSNAALNNQQVLVASTNDIANNFDREIMLIPKAMESLQPYLRGSTVSYIIKGTLRSGLTQKLDGVVKVRYQVD